MKKKKKSKKKGNEGVSTGEIITLWRVKIINFLSSLSLTNVDLDILYTRGL